MISASDIIIRLVASFVFGGLVGIEREMQQKSAGLKTHILVCIGSCLIMLTSLYIFDIYKDIATVDPSRIAAGVITGIGFLGAGAIIRYSGDVKGLTTAACLWVTAAIGLATGCGFFNAAVITAILVLGVLLLLGYVEGTLWNRRKH